MPATNGLDAVLAGVACETRPSGEKAHPSDPAAIHPALPRGNALNDPVDTARHPILLIPKTPVRFSDADASRRWEGRTRGLASAVRTVRHRERL